MELGVPVPKGKVEPQLQASSFAGWLRLACLGAETVIVLMVALRSFLSNFLAFSQVSSPLYLNLPSFPENLFP